MGLTYSLQTTGKHAHTSGAQLGISDTQALVPAQAKAASLNTAFLCKRPDGSERLFRIDAERSIPGQLTILVPLGDY